MHHVLCRVVLLRFGITLLCPMHQGKHNRKNANMKLTHAVCAAAPAVCIFCGRSRLLMPVLCVLIRASVNIFEMEGSCCYRCSQNLLSKGIIVCVYFSQSEEEDMLGFGGSSPAKSSRSPKAAKSKRKGVKDKKVSELSFSLHRDWESESLVTKVRRAFSIF